MCYLFLWLAEACYISGIHLVHKADVFSTSAASPSAQISIDAEVIHAQ